MRSDFGGFYRYWQEWESRLNLPIKRAGSKLSFPSLVEVPKEDGSTKFSLSHPICIYNAPLKASSSVRSTQLRNTIAVEGGFHLSRADGGAPLMIAGHCALTIFSTELLADRKLRLMQLDAMHFDMESHEKQTAFHPMFHVQRDTSNRLNDAVVKDVVGRLAGINSANIDIDRSGRLGTQHLRLPTPQMDVFAVLTALIADFFSNPTADGSVKIQFRAILEHFASSSNVLRDSFAARALNMRANGFYMCPAHWYSEIS